MLQLFSLHLTRSQGGDQDAVQAPVAAVDEDKKKKVLHPGDLYRWLNMTWLAVTVCFAERTSCHFKNIIAL